MPDIRVLRDADLQALWDLCSEHPVENLFVASRIRRFGLERWRLGCDVLGFFRDGRLVAALHQGANLVPVGSDEAAISAFVRRLGGRRTSSSIMGPADQVMPLYHELARHRAWQSPRDERPSQPLMEMDTDPEGEIDPRLQPITMKDFNSYFEASVRMYTEEVGVSPLTGGYGYESHVEQTIKEGRAFGIVEDGRVIYKSDVGAGEGYVCQVQGVWLDPHLRGQGLSVPAMKGVVKRARERWPRVSLYVNDYNAPALALYKRCGFRQTGEFATILY